MSSTDIFLQSVRDALNSSQNVLSFILGLCFLVIIYGIIQVIMHYYNDYRKTIGVVNPNTKTQIVLPKHLPEFNPAQKKVLYDIISEFKKREIIAEAIPVSVLERYSVYFFHMHDRLKISNYLANRMVPQLYPINVNTCIEIEIISDNKLNVFERNVLLVKENYLVLPKIDNPSVKLNKNQSVTISYSIKNQFISGESLVLNFLTNDRMMISYPKNLQISNERRFSRLPLKDIDGLLSSAYTEGEFKSRANLKDISLEGVRLKTAAMLKKNSVYRLSFEDHSFSTEYVFQNFECIVSKSIVGDDLYEYGMSFVYLNLENRAKLVNYLKDLANRLKAGH